MKDKNLRTNDTDFANALAGIKATNVKGFELPRTGGGIMGSIEIPAIDVNLPIYHGTDAETLKKGIGRMEGTSLPVGVKNTHAVLTGHTGLSSAWR